VHGWTACPSLAYTAFLHKKQGETMQTARLSITGMDHEGCADTLTGVLEAIDGVRTVSVSLAHNDATVQYDEHLATQEHLLSAVNDAGFIGEVQLEAAV